MRAPEACSTMTELREAIDTLDRKVVELLGERARYIDRAAEIKSTNGLPARIPARVEEVVARVRATAEDAGADPALMEALWRQMIEWSIAHEEDKLRTSYVTSGLE